MYRHPTRGTIPGIRYQSSDNPSSNTAGILRDDDRCFNEVANVEGSRGRLWRVQVGSSGGKWPSHGPSPQKAYMHVSQPYHRADQVRVGEQKTICGGVRLNADETVYDEGREGRQSGEGDCRGLCSVLYCVETGQCSSALVDWLSGYDGRLLISARRCTLLFTAWNASSVRTTNWKIAAHSSITLGFTSCYVDRPSHDRLAS
jgi:hypothetical protein